MSKAHDRLVKINFTADDSAETVVVNSVKYSRDGGSTDFDLKFTQTSPNTTGTQIVLGELLPPPTAIQLDFTVQA